ncbi:MAG: hypothetical protein Q9219_007377 [cf. Caloplaca sp. 3 TL-2023]
MHRDLPEDLRAYVEHNEQVKVSATFPKYLLKQDSKEILVSEDDLLLVDRYIARGDVVKRNPLDAQSGTVISSSCTCDLCPSYMVSVTESGDSSATTLAEFTASSITNVNMHDLAPPRIWNREDFVVYQDWIGTITWVHEELTVSLEGGGVVIIKDSQDVEERVPCPTTSVSDYVRFGWDSSRKLPKEKLVPADPCFYGQRVRTSRKVLSNSHWLVGSYKRRIKPDGVIIGIKCTSVEVDWIAQKPDGPTAIKPDNLIPGLVLESGAVKNYGLSRSMEGETGSESSQFGVTPAYVQAGEAVLFRDLRTAAAKYEDQLSSSCMRPVTSIHFKAGGIPEIGIVVSEIISTTSSVRVQWQDNTITDELSTSVCPYDEVDDHDAWPGEIVSLKDQEESSADPSYEKLLRTRTVGVVQSVNAIERIALVRWFDGADILIAGEDHDQIVRPHSTLGHITGNVSETSLFEIEAHKAIAKRRGDIVRLYRLEEDLPKRNERSNNTYFDSDHGWYGEIVDLLSDGRVSVRLGGLDEVRDMTYSILDLDTAYSADDDTTESDVTVSTDEFIEDSVSDFECKHDSRISRASARAATEHPKSGSDDEWMTESSEDAQDDPESPIQQDLQVGRSSIIDGSDLEMGGNNIQETSSPDQPHKAETELKGEDTSLSEETLQPARFEILEGSGPKHTFTASTGNKGGKWLQAVFREHRIMRSSLPERVYVRTWESSLELIRVLIVGPSGTPYAFAPFLFDIYLNEQFPYYAPSAFFHSWTNGIGRVNPNLYEDGRVCLSLLGTWHSEKDNESWVTGKSSILQIIVSLVGLVLVKEPYYNEAGYEMLQGTAHSKPTSALYSEKAFMLSRRFVVKAIESLPDGFEDTVLWLYMPSPDGPHLLRTIAEDCQIFLQDDPSSNAEEVQRELLNKYHITSPKLSLGVLVLLRKLMPHLRALLESGNENATVSKHDG